MLKAIFGAQTYAESDGENIENHCGLKLGSA